jgi:hypothetical protein
MADVSRALILTPAARRAFDRLAADCRRVFVDRLDAVVAYDAGRAVVFAKTIAPDDLSALAPLADAWRHDGLEIPLLLTRGEFRRSLDAFPLEYQAIVDRHIRIAGDDPFAGVAIADEDLRRACEVQAKAHVIHLRQGWLEAGGDAAALGTLVHDASAPWRVLLENVARLRGIDAADPARLGAWAAEITGLTPAVASELLAPGTEAGDRARLAGHLSAYLAAAERLWAAIDSWRV